MAIHASCSWRDLATWPGDDEARLVTGIGLPKIVRKDWQLRPACLSDIPALIELAVRSKAWWGYDEAFHERVCRRTTGRRKATASIALTTGTVSVAFMRLSQ